MDNLYTYTIPTCNVGNVSLKIYYTILLCIFKDLKKIVENHIQIFGCGNKATAYNIRVYQSYP